MRISGGGARGVVLRVPKGDVTRPATDGMRQAVFSSLASRLPGARFVDLFAGSGAYGLEAFSRGAAGGVFVEKNPRAVDCIRQNIAAVAKSTVRPGTNLRVLSSDVLSWKPEAGGAPDLVFVDPPYGMISEAGPVLFSRLEGWWPEGADPVVVFEMPGELALEPAGWVCVKRLGKGARQPTAAFFRRAAVVGCDSP
jgi:16S rRNA (guanine966-N2)-methyltransferase